MPRDERIAVAERIHSNLGGHHQMHRT